MVLWWGPTLYLATNSLCLVRLIPICQWSTAASCRYGTPFSNIKMEQCRTTPMTGPSYRRRWPAFTGRVRLGSLWTTHLWWMNSSLWKLMALKVMLQNLESKQSRKQSSWQEAWQDPAETQSSHTTASTRFLARRAWRRTFFTTARDSGASDRGWWKRLASPGWPVTALWTVAQPWERQCWGQFDFGINNSQTPEETTAFSWCSWSSYAKVLHPLEGLLSEHRLGAVDTNVTSFTNSTSDSTRPKALYRHLWQGAWSTSSTWWWRGR